MQKDQTTQLVLFESELPNWKSLPREVQASIQDVLSQLLLDALERHCSDHITTTEDHDVS